MVPSFRRVEYLALLVVLAAAGCRQPVEFTGQVTGVSDGDTLTIMRDGRPERVRIAGVDAPEGRQPYGRRSRQHLAELAFGRVATVTVQGRDRYGRTLGRVVVDGADVGLEQVRAGFAWHYVEYSKDPALARAEAEARRARRGLWQAGDALPPWEFRRRSGS
jgi:endonuclease YncB( thermonuclease family)